MQSRREILKLMGHATLAAGSAPLLAGCARAPQESSAAPANFADLAARFNGTVLLPASKRYDAARRTFSFNPRTDRRPAAIARTNTEITPEYSLWGSWRGPNTLK